MKSLWKAVNIAKDINCDEIPAKMFKANVEISKDELPEAFAEHFESKITNLLMNIAIDPQVCNGSRKLTGNEFNFMTSGNILKAVQPIKLKNLEGNDRIPQRILIDDISVLLAPLTCLFSNIYEQKMIPQQWKLAKITPVHKQGNKI